MVVDILRDLYKKSRFLCIVMIFASWWGAPLFGGVGSWGVEKWGVARVASQRPGSTSARSVAGTTEQRRPQKNAGKSKRRLPFLASAPVEGKVVLRMWE